VRCDHEERQNSEGVTYEIDSIRPYSCAAPSSGHPSLIEAVALVVLVVVVFLQSWRASVIRRACRWLRRYAGALLLAGFSINSLTLFGLVLATGIVVDDAIVVGRISSEKIEDGLKTACRGARGHGEVTRPIIPSAWYCARWFVPVAFVSGLTGILRSSHNGCGEHAHLDLIH